MTRSSDQDILDKTLSTAKKMGATNADAILVRGLSLGVSVRHGALEDVERSEGADLGLRVLVGQKQACVSVSSMSDESIDTMVKRAIDMAKLAPDDPYCGLAETATTPAPSSAALELYDDKILSADELEILAQETEASALSIKGISNSEGASAGFGGGEVALATTKGFFGTYKSSNFSLSVSTIAGEGLAMERDYDYDSKRHFADLASPKSIGLKAAENTLRRLAPRKVKSQKVPIIFDPRVSNGLVSHFASAINGQSIARGTSFLKNKMDKALFNKDIQIIDNAHLKRGARSKIFDGEGLPTGTNTYVKDGVLQSWVLDCATARQLGLQSTGRASRGTSSTPSPSVCNLYMENGSKSVDDMIGEIENGFYVTELIGMGVNNVTGDYSRGATGLWIENGVLQYPVNEITISSNLLDMFLNLSAADDLEFRYGINAPTLRVDGMTIAGA